MRTPPIFFILCLLSVKFNSCTSLSVFMFHYWQSPCCCFVVTKPKTQIATKLRKSGCDKTQKLRLWQNSKTSIVIKLKTLTIHKTKNSSSDKTKKNQLHIFLLFDKGSFNWNHLTPGQRMRSNWGSLLRSNNVSKLPWTHPPPFGPL